MILRRVVAAVFTIALAASSPRARGERARPPRGSMSPPATPRTGGESAFQQQPSRKQQQQQKPRPPSLQDRSPPVRGLPSQVRVAPAPTAGVVSPTGTATGPAALPLPPPPGNASGETSPYTPPRLNAVRVTSAPVLDGRLDDAAWTLGPGTSTFTQQVPDDGAPPSERTTLRVLYDDEALYIGFDCEQGHTPVVGRLTRRDEDSESDWVWVHLDSRRDARTAYFFAVNVRGVLGDAIMHDGSMTSFEWDENWEGRAVVTPQGWSAEMRIPLRILRFTPGLPVQDWGLWASRFIAVSQEKDDWPHIRREIAAPIPFFGRLDELHELAPGGAIEVKPFALSQLRYRTADQTLVKRGFDVGASAGLDLKLHVTQSLTLDAAINPDFAQVEADQLILNLNNYEIQYPEKRPLFLEGSDLFATPMGIFYSRRIGSSPPIPIIQAGDLGSQPRLVDIPGAATIYGALKLAGRFGDAWTVGLLSALASRSDYEVQSFDASNTPVGSVARHTVEPLTAFNVFRVRRELGTRAQIGAIATATTRFEKTGDGRFCPTGQPVNGAERCFRDATVGGLDAIWRSAAGEYVASGQLVGSAINNGVVETQLDGTEIGPGDRGLGGWFRAAKDGGRRFLAEAVYTGIGRKLTYNDLGFMPRQNLHEGKLGFELRSLTPDSFTLERHLRLDLTARTDLDGLDLGKLIELGFWIRTRGFWNFRVAADFAPSRFDDRELGDGSALEAVQYVGGKMEFSSDPRARWGIGLKSEVRFLDGGMRLDAEAPLVLRALPQFAIDLTPRITYSSGEERFARNAQENGNPPILAPQYIFGRLLARSVGATLRAAYTFTPRLSLQTFAQLFLDAGHYTDFRQAPRAPFSQIRQRDLSPLVTAGVPGDADFQDAALNVNVVLRWEYRLGSTFFLVYSRSQVPSVPLGAEDAGLRLSAIRSLPAVDLILAKLSFWWAS